MGKQFFPSFLHVGTAIWNFHSSESCDILEITTAEAKIVLPEFMNGRLVSVKSSDGSVLEEWEEAPPSTVQLPMIQSATWSQSPQYIYIYIYLSDFKTYVNHGFQRPCHVWYGYGHVRCAVHVCEVCVRCAMHVRYGRAMCDACVPCVRAMYDAYVQSVRIMCDERVQWEQKKCDAHV